MSSTARATLEKARLFLRQAALYGLDDREACLTNLEAAIVFGRSSPFAFRRTTVIVTASRNGGLCASKNSRALCRFLLETRNLILKFGPEIVRRVTSIATELTGRYEASGVAQVARRAPWYRRPPTIRPENIVAAVSRFLRRSRHRIANSARRVRQRIPASTIISDDLYFQDATWGSRPACELIRHYLDMLEPIVGAAESRFDEPTAQVARKLGLAHGVCGSRMQHGPPAGVFAARTCPSPSRPRPPAGWRRSPAAPGPRSPSASDPGGGPPSPSGGGASSGSRQLLAWARSSAWRGEVRDVQTDAHG